MTGKDHGARLQRRDPNPRPSGYESLQWCRVTSDLQGFREIGSSSVRSHLLVLVPVWYPFRGSGSDQARPCVAVVAMSAPDATVRGVDLDPSLADHLPLGISSGVFGKLRGDWHRLVDAASSVSTSAVELSALSGDELPGLVAYLQSESHLPFGYVSVHAPVKGIEPVRGDSLLHDLPPSVRSIVVHPDGTLDLDSCRGLASRLTLENMDFRKDAGRVAAELEPFFAALPDAGFCLDIAHAHSIDPSMAAAHELLDRFRVRLRQVHLSSLGDDGHHLPLTEGDESLFAPVLDRCRNVPWILEALPPPGWSKRWAQPE